MSDGFQYILYDLATAAVHTLYLHLLLNIPANHRRSGLVCFLLCATYFVFVEGFSLLNGNALLKIVLGLALTIFIAWYGYGHRLSKSIFFGFLFYLILAFSELIAASLLALADKEAAVVVNGVQWGVFPFAVINSTVPLPIVMALRKTMNRQAYSYPLWSVLPLCVTCFAVIGVWIDEMQRGMNNVQLSPFFLLCSVLLIASVVVGTLVNERHLRMQQEANEKKMALQEMESRHAYYEEKLRDEERIRSLYHDMKNHLLLLEQGKQEENDLMITQLEAQMADYETYYKTGNVFLDVIIRDKARTARENHIDFSVLLHFEEASFMEPLDISSLFGNALDNAIEASLKLPKNQRLITVKGKRVQNMLSIVIENNALTLDNNRLKTSKPDSFLHGHGLASIERVAQKYDGQCAIRQEKGKR